MFPVCGHSSGSHGSKGDVYRAAAVWSGLHLPAEEGGGGGAAAATASSRLLHAEQNAVAELCALTDVLCALGQRWRPVTGSFFICFLTLTAGFRRWATCCCCGYVNHFQLGLKVISYTIYVQCFWVCLCVQYVLSEILRHGFFKKPKNLKYVENHGQCFIISLFVLPPSGHNQLSQV